VPSQPANVATAYHEDGDVSFRASAAVTGKRFIKISGDVTGGPGLSTDFENVYRCAPCGAGERAVGVAKYDVAINKRGGMHGVPSRIVPVTVGTGGVTAGQKVMSDGTGQAVAWASAASEANAVLGVAMSGATAGNDAQVKLAL
jgi:hypothetical protein